MVPRLARHGLAVLIRKRADAIANTVLAVGELGLALRHVLADLLAPGDGVDASRGRGPGDRHRRGGHRHAGQELQGQRRAGAAKHRP